MSNSSYYIDEIGTLFDDIFKGLWQPITTQQPSRLNRLITNGDWPPSNVKVNQKTKQLIIEVALAGYNKDNINLSFDTDALILTIKKPRITDETFVCIQRGVREAEEAIIRWKIDPRYYDRESVDAEFTDGLLIVRVNPRTEVAPKKISIFGNLSLENKEKEKLEESQVS